MGIIVRLVCTSCWRLTIHQSKYRRLRDKPETIVQCRYVAQIGLSEREALLSPGRSSENSLILLYSVLLLLKTDQKEHKFVHPGGTEHVRPDGGICWCVSVQRMLYDSLTIHDVGITWHTIMYTNFFPTRRTSSNQRQLLTHPNIPARCVHRANSALHSLDLAHTTIS